MGESAPIDAPIDVNINVQTYAILSARVGTMLRACRACPCVAFGRFPYMPLRSARQLGLLLVADAILLQSSVFSPDAAVVPPSHEGVDIASPPKFNMKRVSEPFNSSVRIRK